MKIALAHDYLVQYGGAERVLEALCEVWPDAPIYTLLHEPNFVHGRFSDKQVHTSFLQKIPFSRKYHRVFPPLMMFGIEQFDFSDFDVVLSDSSSFSKNLITGPNTLHITYCHTPMRYAWDDCQYYTQEFNFPKIVKKIVPLLMNYIRMWDFAGSNGVDYFVANSNFVSSRITKYYKRDSVVVHPPVDVNKFSSCKKEEQGDYFLMVGRMMKYKKMDLVIEAFNEMKLPLKIVGRGMEYENLQKLAGPTIEFLGRIPDQELREIYSKSQGFLFPQEEDFGIVAIEALASGRPIIAYRSGDIVEHVEDGKTGVFFEKQTKDDVIDAIQKFQKISFDSEYIKATSDKFEREIFKTKMKNFIEDKYSEFIKNNASEENKY